MINPTDTTPSATIADHDTAEAFLRQLKAETEATKNAPPLPEDTPDAFTEKHVLPFVVQVTLRMEELSNLTIANDRRLSLLERDVTELVLMLRKYPLAQGNEGLRTLFEDFGGRLEARLEEIRDAISDTGDAA